MLELVLNKHPGVDVWSGKFSNQSQEILLGGFPSEMKAGDVVKASKALWPNFKIGVASSVFGPATQAAFGSIVWMK